jgi:uncharacterized membrane protein (GlpM family)
MLYIILKLLISALLIVIIAEVAKRNSLFGGILASIPLVSVLAMFWLYIDTKNTQAVALLSRDIFWLVLPSLILFVSLPILLKHKLNFYSALSASIFFTACGYFLMILALKKFGMRP